MSLIIEQSHSLSFLQLFQSPSQETDLSESEKQSITNQEEHTNDSHGGRRRKNYKVEVNSVENYYIGSGRKVALWKRIQFYPETSMLTYIVKIILNQSNHIQIFDKARRLLYFKAISQKNSLKTSQAIIFTFNPHNGIVKIVMFNGFLLIQKIDKEYLEYVMEKYFNLNLLKDYLLLLLSGIYISPQTALNQGFVPNPSLRSIQNIMTKMAVGLSVPCSDTAESNIVKNYAAHWARRDKIIACLISPTSNEVNQLCLYSKYEQNTSRVDISFTESQLSIISTKIRPPTLVKCKNLFQNNCILNYIKINNHDRLRLTKINSGGFSTIFITQIQYWYVFSGSENQVIGPLPQNTFNNQNMLKKTVIFKKDNQKEQKSRNRINHQANILKKIKNANALFLPKYYISLNQSNINKILFCDYIPNPNLSQFIMINRQTLSSSSKVLILLMLAQGIKFISSYQIYHLDIKPQNLMITKSMMVKIIDFGQSFHPQVCSDDFVPGFTMPYSSPETYYPIDTNIFSSKSDIFSLGMIACQLFNQKLPFYFFDPECHFDRYVQSNFEDFWFYAPEECEDRNDPFVFRLLQLIMGRCLDAQPQRRPELDWLCLILREFLDFYY